MSDGNINYISDTIKGYKSRGSNYCNITFEEKSSNGNNIGISLEEANNIVSYFNSKNYQIKLNEDHDHHIFTFNIKWD